MGPCSGARVTSAQNSLHPKIIVRQKPNRKERTLNGQTLLHQLKKDKVHCLVAFNSIAAFEAIQEGYPAITLGPNAAGPT